VPSGTEHGKSPLTRIDTLITKRAKPAFTKRTDEDGGYGVFKKVARHSTALGLRRCRCYLPVLAEFTRNAHAWHLAEADCVGEPCAINC